LHIFDFTPDRKRASVVVQDG